MNVIFFGTKQKSVRTNNFTSNDFTSNDLRSNDLTSNDLTSNELTSERACKRENKCAKECAKNGKRANRRGRGMRIIINPLKGSKKAKVLLLLKGQCEGESDSKAMNVVGGGDDLMIRCTILTMRIIINPLKGSKKSKARR